MKINWDWFSQDLPENSAAHIIVTGIVLIVGIVVSGLTFALVVRLITR